MSLTARPYMGATARRLLALVSYVDRHRGKFGPEQLARLDRDMATLAAHIIGKGVAQPVRAATLRVKVYGGALKVSGATYRGVIAATSQKDAAMATGQSQGAFRAHWAETANPVELEAATSEPGRVFVVLLADALRMGAVYVPLDNVKAALA